MFRKVISVFLIIMIILAFIVIAIGIDSQDFYVIFISIIIAALLISNAIIMETLI